MALMAAVGVAGCVAPGAAPPGVDTVRAERKAGVAAPLASGETQLVVRTVPAGAPAGQELRGAPLRGGVAPSSAPSSPARPASCFPTTGRRRRR